MYARNGFWTAATADFLDLWDVSFYPPVLPQWPATNWCPILAYGEPLRDGKKDPYSALERLIDSHFR